jgi:hypothetical protein
VEMRNGCKILVVREGTRPFGDLEVDGRIILKRILR